MSRLKEIWRKFVRALAVVNTGHLSHDGEDERPHLPRRWD